MRECAQPFLFLHPMKYRRLTREQLEELHEEFARFLATQSIDKKEWEEIKQHRPHVAEEEIDLFSDLVWEGVLDKVTYLENITPTQMQLFHATPKEIRLIAIRVLNENIDLTTSEGFSWFKKHFMSDLVQIMRATKKYSEDPKSDLFGLIEKGAQITRGELYHWFEEILNES